MSELQLNQEKLMDKLGERWLFEKKTVTIYQQIIEKLEACGFDSRGVEQLREFQSQEAQHQKTLEEYIRECGGNTRRKTPSQKIVETESAAFTNIVAESDDPSHLLHVLLDAEMEDNASWELLIQLSKKVGQDAFVSRFQTAMNEEKTHLRGVRTMVSRAAREDMIEQVQQPQA